jgi:hypothetical protein
MIKLTQFIRSRTSPRTSPRPECQPEACPGSDGAAAAAAAAAKAGAAKAMAAAAAAESPRTQPGDTLMAGAAGAQPGSLLQALSSQLGSAAGTPRSRVKPLSLTDLQRPPGGSGQGTPRAGVRYVGALVTSPAPAATAPGDGSPAQGVGGSGGPHRSPPPALQLPSRQLSGLTTVCPFLLSTPKPSSGGGGDGDMPGTDAVAAVAAAVRAQSTGGGAPSADGIPLVPASSGPPPVGWAVAGVLPPVISAAATPHGTNGGSGGEAAVAKGVAALEQRVARLRSSFEQAMEPAAAWAAGSPPRAPAAVRHAGAGGAASSRDDASSVAGEAEARGRAGLPRPHGRGTLPPAAAAPTAEAPTPLQRSGSLREVARAAAAAAMAAVMAATSSGGAAGVAAGGAAQAPRGHRHSSSGCAALPVSGLEPPAWASAEERRPPAGSSADAGDWSPRAGDVRSEWTPDCGSGSDGGGSGRRYGSGRRGGDGRRSRSPPPRPAFVVSAPGFGPAGAALVSGGGGGGHVAAGARRQVVELQRQNDALVRVLERERARSDAVHAKVRHWPGSPEGREGPGGVFRAKPSLTARVACREPLVSWRRTIRGRCF